MSKIAVVYWSGTGNTEAMAFQVAEGVKQAGAEVSLFTAAEFDVTKMDDRIVTLRGVGYRFEKE